MNLNDFNKNASSSKLNKLFESFSGKKINFSKMTIREASALSRKLDRKISIASNKMQGKASKDKPLQEAIMMKSTIDRWLFEQHKKLLEDELQQAEVILAAKDLVDRMQKIIEDISKMVNEELPPLGDSIRNQISSEKAEGFVSSATEALNGVLEQVRQARSTLDSQTRSLAGEETPDMDMGAGADTGAAGGGEEGSEELPDMELGSDETVSGSDGFEGFPEAVGGKNKVGRSLRV
jgi:hypothetical protein